MSSRSKYKRKREGATNSHHPGGAQAEDGKIPLEMTARPGNANTTLGMMERPRRRALSDSISERKLTKEVFRDPRLKNNDVEYFCMTVKDIVFHLRDCKANIQRTVKPS